jgi:hypothetical protein
MDAPKVSSIQTENQSVIMQKNESLHNWPLDRPQLFHVCHCQADSIKQSRSSGGKNSEYFYFVTDKIKLLQLPVMLRA